ncbi:MAG: dockerin type I repeat-containing protein [Phycisphaerales bacterium]|nr:dockerin type I repeat-containing protein [Phycisphaerales bacterium]
MSSGNGIAIVVNCVIANNTAPASAGLHAVGGTHRIVANCTILNNVAAEGEAGVTIGAGTLLTNCIIRGSGPGDEVHGDGSLVVFSNIEGGHPGVGNFDADPLFADAAYRLSDASPCIDAGWTLGVPVDRPDLDGDGDVLEPVPFDLDGAPQFVDADAADTGCGAGAVVDVGAFEYPRGPAVEVVTGDLDGNGVVDAADLAIVLAHFGDADCFADPNADGVVDADDITMILVAWSRP